ncbi:hypothetical protein DSO57_1020050 [Entomophthora muscae]|uniref:Uncharacterized protein n=1 Tax=Entomophthora muscae TaxID=34485 RepID=A0ACC2RUW6_9FUNG|nr:hypothetical protein DSO57_1020050 [Entomophthora muscae]
MLASKNSGSPEAPGLRPKAAVCKKVRFELDPEHELRAKNKASKIFKPTTKHGVSPHPIGVKPLGNFYLRDASATHDSYWRRKSLGFFDRLTDETILKLLEYCEPQEIIKLSFVSKGFYAFSYFDDPWKELVVDEFNGDFDFKGSWRLTYIYRAFSNIIPFDLNPFPVQISDFYSDVLFQPWLCASTGIAPFLGKENIDRRSNLSLEDFIEEYEVPNRPVIITDVIENWPAFKTWTEEKLTELYGEVKFRAEAIDISLKRYFEYAHQNLDESPVYLFDKKFGDNCPGMLADFEVPIYFRDDLFQLLGNDRRPDYRWLIIGPARSGSTFHKDPNATSA